MINKILVPLDGTITSEMALNYAIQFSSKLGAELIVAYMNKLGADANHGAYASHIDQKIEKAKTEINVDKVFIDGDPIKGLVSCVNQRNIDLMIMMAKSADEYNRNTMAELGNKILSRIKSPVLQIRPDKWYEQSDGTIKTILVPLDGSKEGELVLECVGEIASTFQAEVILLEIMVIHEEAEVGLLAHDSYMAKQLESRKILSLNYLDKIADRLKGRHANIKVKCEAESGLAANEIIYYANETEADLVAMSTRGYTGLRRWLFGSTTSEVARDCNQNLLLVKQ